MQSQFIINNRGLGFLVGGVELVEHGSARLEACQLLLVQLDV